MKIAVRVPNWIGDTVLAIPALQSLKHNFPEARLWVVAKEWVKDLFIPGGLAENVIPLPEPSDVKSSWEAAQKLRTFSFDAGLLLTNSFGSAFLFYLAKIPKRWGYATDGRSVLLTKSVPLKDDDSSRHQVHYYLDLLSGLGLKIVSPELKLHFSAGQQEAARHRLRSLGLDPNKPLIVINPGASYGPAKRWPPVRFAELATLYQKRKNAEILVIGSVEEAEIAESISSLMDSKPCSLSGKTTLPELIGLISLATLFITNDSGPMHIANALGIPVVAIFGPTDPAQTGPFQKPSIFIKENVPCWPCSYRKCPYDHRCMLNIDSEEVYLRSDELWR